MDPPWFREVAIMSKQLTAKSATSKRYENPKVVEHLASQYILGTLTAKVHQRVEQLAVYNEVLAQRIYYWQTRFVSLDQQTAELPPSEHVWKNIAENLEIEKQPTMTNKLNQQVTGNKANQIESFSMWVKSWFVIYPTRYVSVFSVILLAVLMLFIVKPFNQQNDPLSYVAVLTEQDGQAHIVATTYGESKKLIVNVIGVPSVDDDQSLELWVISKTDAQARSLGVIPVGHKLIEQQLTTAQWRLIKDSDSLIVTLEELGGSALGEPSNSIVSRGLCVRLKEWNKNA